MSKQTLALLVTLVVVLGLCTVKAHAQTYYTVKEALAYLYPLSEKISFEKKDISKELAAKIKKQTGDPDIPSQWTIYKATSGHKIDGYAIVDNILGKELPITYIVSIDPHGNINEVEILVYRESHGGQVKNRAFRKQFVGKNKNNELAVGRDITPVSSATISSHQIVKGVRRVLMVWHEFYGQR